MKLEVKKVTAQDLIKWNDTKAFLNSKLIAEYKDNMLFFKGIKSGPYKNLEHAKTALNLLYNF